jgi:hypothetical protein
VGVWDRFRRYMKEGPASVQPFTLLPSDDFEREVKGATEPLATAAGFSSVRALRWVRENGPGIYGLLELRWVKGTDLTPVWGISLDSVPHLSASKRLAWHRGPKAARFDLSYDPLDYEPDLRPWAVSRFATVDELKQEATDFGARVLASATRFLDPLRSVANLVEAFEAKEHRPALRLPFDCYPEEVFAYAFVLARSGAVVKAQQVLQKALDLAEVPVERHEELRAALTAADAG